VDTGEAALRGYVETTLGFELLGAETGNAMRVCGLPS